MKNLIIFICLFFIPFSCTHLEQDKYKGEVLHLENSGFKDWASLIHIEEVVNFEDNIDTLLTIAKKCLISDNRILFWDYKMKCVYVYDCQGSFLYVIGKQGGAEFECADLRDVTFFGDKNEKIELLDATGILVFNAENGHFIEKRKLGFSNMSEYFKFVHLKNEDYLFFTDMGEYSVYKWQNGNLVGIRKRDGYQLITSRFYMNENTCLVFPDYGKFVIDEFHNNKLTPKYYLDFGNGNLPESELPKTNSQFGHVDNMEKYFKCVVEVMESDNLLYLKVVGPSQTYYDIYKDKKSDKLWAGPSDLNLGLTIVAIENDVLYGLVYPEYISKESLFYDTVQKYFKKGEESTPILIKFRMYE